MRALAAGLVALILFAAVAGGQQQATLAASTGEACPENTDEVPATAQPPDADVVAAFRKAIRDERPNATEQLALWEAGIVESGLRNLDHGDADSLGALQERVSVYGRDHALDPYASAVRFLRDAKSLRPWRGTAGILAADVQRPREDLRGRYDEEEGKARRYLTGGTSGGDRGDAAPVPVSGCVPGDGEIGAVRPVLDYVITDPLANPGHGLVMNAGQLADLRAGGFDRRLVRVLAWIGQRHRVVITALRHDHSEATSSGNRSNHADGRAADIGSVDGKLCSPYGPQDPCGRLLVALTKLGRDTPTELIGSFDADGPGPAWSQADHADHLHVAFDAAVDSKT